MHTDVRVLRVKFSFVPFPSVYTAHCLKNNPYEISLIRQWIVLKLASEQEM